MVNKYSEIVASTTGSSTLRPVVYLTLEPFAYASTGYIGLAYSTTLVRQPTMPTSVPMLALGGTISYSGTGTAPALAGGFSASTPAAPALAGAGQPAAGGTAPTTIPPRPILQGVNDFLGYVFSVQTFFPDPATEVGATAVLYSEVGSPPWEGMSVPVNGKFKLEPSMLSTGDQIRVQVTPGSPGSASDTGTSSPIEFTVALSTVNVIGNIRGSAIAEIIVAQNVATDGTYLYYFGQNPLGAVKLYKSHLTTDVTDQVTNLQNNQANSDTPGGASTVLVGNNPGFAVTAVYANFLNTTSQSKMFKIDSTNTVTQISNLRNNQANPDTIINFGLPPPGETTPTTAPVIFNGFYYFSGLNSNGVTKVFKLSTSDVIAQITNSRNDQTQADAPSSAVIFNGAIYCILNGTGGAAAAKLHKISTADVVTQISNTRNNNALSDSITIMGYDSNYLYFLAQNANGVSKMFKCSTGDVVTQITNFTGNQASNDSITATIGCAFNNFFYFSAAPPLTNVGNKLYKVDASTDTFTQISNIVGSNYSGDGLNISSSFIKALSDGIYLTATSPLGATKLFRVDTSDVITQAATFNGFSSNENFSNNIFEISGNKYIFSSGGISTLPKLFRIDASSQAVMLTDFGATDQLNASILRQIGNTLYFGGQLGIATKMIKFTP